MRTQFAKGRRLLRSSGRRPWVKARRLAWPAAALGALDAMVLAAAGIAASTVVAWAGDTYPNGGATWSGNGDCWQAQTPLMCRTTYTGRGSLIYMRIIDQLGGDTELHNRADEACNNWNTTPGPQYCSWNATANDTWTYLRSTTHSPRPTASPTTACLVRAQPPTTRATFSGRKSTFPMRTRRTCRIRATERTATGPHPSLRTNWATPMALRTTALLARA